MSKGVCEYAFAVLENKLKGTPLKSLTSYEPDTTLTSQRYPLFVTWNRNGNLRGCIGTFADMPLEQGVKRFALSSAFQDSRFPPITASELPQLSVSVTLLANFTPIDKWDDWEVGVHGLRVEFDYHHRPHSGTFLPSVAEEEGWDKKTTVWNLLRKSDVFDVAKSDTVRFYEQALAHKTMELTRYEGLKSSMQWSEYEQTHK
ncbi:hypothetical protein DIURU_002921 [Diutina rugosa]|uniref:AMMECR1 domain-containing protein n=1 Tax=Diutina rugosa TaxID=5481 RepID=A0A642UMN8_DIURU|nr:uncharacterized protein DIURU_002921 [Diutina rugosa]KAA8902127.1 hypothetical protein DIURU_002921 [Diutina rugosa]